MAGRCKNCGKCCAGILLLSPKEIKRIKKYIKEQNIEIINRQSIFNKEFVDVCPFLSHNNTCNIYQVRPEICTRFQCYEEPTYDLDYRDLQVVNMQTTFFPNSYCPEVDLEVLKERLKQNKKKLYGRNS